MSIINGAIDRRRELLASCNLRENPFVKTEPKGPLIDQVFIGRERELREAAMAVVDRPRNVLVVGGYGYGKTTFVRKLLRELAGAKRHTFLTGYAPLRQDSAAGFQLAALAALAEGALALSLPGSPLHDFARGVRDELARLEERPGDRLAPDLRFRDGLQLAAAHGVERVVLAIDELDKRDAQVVQSVLMGSRFFLDLEASFVLTGRLLDAFADVRSSLLAAFDKRVELGLFTPDESRLVIERNLAAARRDPEPEDRYRPFTDEAVTAIVDRARGMPRPINLMAYAALEQGLGEALTGATSAVQIDPAVLHRALQREGNLIFNRVTSEARSLLEQVFRRAGYVSGVDLDALAPADGVLKAIRDLDDLSREDAVLRLEGTEGAAFAMSPPVEIAIRDLERRRERLRALWADARAATTNAEKGARLEAFAAELFEEEFRITDRNVRTDTEELDLVLEPLPHTEPRFRSTYLIAECKNWRSNKVDQGVVSKLATQLRLRPRHVRQAFLLTTGAATDDAREQARHVYMADKVEIMILDADAIEAHLANVHPLRDLLGETHRRLVLRSG
jgi:type II secretory pathway predicted ATPase ExeA/Holliday junction resolvase-like predicted endonuclease